MLTDIFAIRYENFPIFQTFSAREKRLMIQSMTILEELYPYWTNKEGERERDKNFWAEVHKRVSNELGLQWLHFPFYEAQVGLAQYRREETRRLDEIEICRRFMNSNPANGEDVDAFVKSRLSVLELGMRKALADVVSLRDTNAALGGLMKASLKAREEQYSSATEELNTRLRYGRFPLHYHNGFIQIQEDDLVSREIEQPFWSLVSADLWKNVDIDMKEALDQRDTGGKDPAIFACKALESAIKIISRQLAFENGREVGAANFIDGLQRGARPFLIAWEADQLKSYFSKIRNPLGHGPGNEPMPTLTTEQSSLAIEVAMSWVKLLVNRFENWGQP